MGLWEFVCVDSNASVFEKKTYKRNRKIVLEKWIGNFNAKVMILLRLKGQLKMNEVYKY